MSKQAKAPKRSFKTNIYGNTVGYVSGRREVEFGCAPHAERWAEAWASGLDLEAAESKAFGTYIEEKN